MRTGHYPVATERYYFRAPGYPYFLAAATLAAHGRAGAVIASAKAANALLGAASAVLLAALSARIFRRRGLAIATGLAAAVHPGLLSLCLDVESEPLFLLLLLAAGYLLLAAADRPSSNLAVAAGAAAAAAALTRPTALVLVPFLAAPLFDRRWPPRARAHIGASALLGFALVLGPWTARNALVFHELIPVNDAAGSAFYQGNSDWMVRFYGLRTKEEYAVWSRAMFADLDRRSDALASGSGTPSPSERSRYFFREAVAQRSGDLAGWARLLARKAWDFARPYPNPLFWPPAVVAGVAAFETTLMLLAFSGLAGLAGLTTGAGERRRGVRTFSIAFLAVALAAHVAFIVVWRYRIPYWDPVLLLYAAPGAARLLSR